MSIAWPVALGVGDRSTIVIDVRSRVLASQYAKQGPAMPAPDISTFKWGVDIVICCLFENMYVKRIDLRGRGEHIRPTRGTGRSLHGAGTNIMGDAGSLNIVRHFLVEPSLHR